MVCAISGRQQYYQYVQQNRIGDHICYYSDLRKIRQHYPRWDVTRSLAQIIEEVVKGWHERLPEQERNPLSASCTQILILFAIICLSAGAHDRRCPTPNAAFVVTVSGDSRPKRAGMHRFHGRTSPLGTAVAEYRS
jgi:hypothetical protein